MTQERKRSDHSGCQGDDKNTIAIFGEVLADVFPDRSVLGGAPYNVARHLQAFGQHPFLITRIGNDQLGKGLLAEMSCLGMDDSGVQCDPGYPTGQVIVHEEEKGAHRFDILPDQAYDYIHSGVTHMVTMSRRPGMTYFGTLAQRNLVSRLALDTFLSDSKGPRFLDMNLRRPWYDKYTIRRSLLRADIVKINEEELRIIADLFHFIGTTDRDHGLYLMQKFDLDCLLVTCGADGSWAIFSDGAEVSVPSQKLGSGLVDTVGAGDGFSAICMLGILQNWSPEKMLSSANAFAAALCGVRGAAPPSRDFYLPFIEKWQ
jgi:fructokinase